MPALTVTRRGPDGRWARRPDAEHLVLWALAAILAGVVFANDWGILTPDTKPEIFLNPWQTARDFARPWLDSPELGSPSFNVGVAPVATVLGAIEALGAPAWVAQRIWRVALLLIAALAARALYRELTRDTPADSAAGRVAAAVAYAANPYVVVGGGTTPTLLPYALLPLFVLALLRGLRERPWRWSALGALALAATSGLNAGVVTILQLAIIAPLAFYVRMVDRARVARLGRLLLQTGGLYLLLSLYWLVPAISALGRGSTVVASTERLDSVNIGSSYAEVLRGLGMWSLYGTGPGGPFLPGQTAYLTSVLVVVLSFGYAVLAGAAVRLSRAPARIFAAASVVTGALLMAAPFPFADRTPWGDLVLALIDAVPGGSAFRTLNKAGGILMIGIALLVGLAVVALLPRLTASWQRLAALLGAVALVLAGTAPAWTGGLFPVTLDLPPYWRDAAAVVNTLSAGPAPGRVQLTPGLKLTAYDFGYAGPDELGNSLFHAPNVFRTTTPSSAPEAAALLGEVDQRLYLGVLPPGAFAIAARLIGVGVVVGRYDSQLPPGTAERVEANLAADPGLGPPDEVGTRADGSRALTIRTLTDTSSRAVVPAAGALVVDGGPDILPELVAAGLMSPSPTLLLAGALTQDGLRAALRDGGRLVLGDDNGRREWSDDPTRTGSLLGPGLGEGRTRALYGSSEQTVARLEGNADLSTSGPGQIFGPFATGDPTLAFDADPTTAWLFGNFRTGVGNAISIRLRQPLPVATMTVRGTNFGDARVSSVRVRADGPDGSVVRDAVLSEWSSFPATVDLGGARVTRVTITVTGVAGTGQGWVGLSEIAIPGLTIRKVARLPAGLPARVATMPELAATPIDVLLHRRSGDPSGLGQEEPRLDRDVTLPDDRGYRLSGTVRLATGISDTAIDNLLGATREVRAWSSSRSSGHPGLRASATLDDRGGEADLETGWIPDAPVLGEWIGVEFPERQLSAFSLTQNAAGAIATSALVSIDDGEPFPVPLGPGKTRIGLPEAMRASSVRILITGRAGEGFVRILDLGLPRPAISAVAKEGCVIIGRIDGQSLWVRLAEPRSALASGQAVGFTSCDGRPVHLTAGAHLVRSVPDFAVDDLRLMSLGAASPASVTPAFEVTAQGPTKRAVTLLADCTACFLSSGQGMNPAWIATQNGRSLGAPTVVEGYAAGWRFEGKAGDRLVASYGPATLASWAWGFSAGTALLCLAIAVAGLRRRRGPASPALVTADSASPAWIESVSAQGPGSRSRLWATVGVFGLAIWLTVGWLPAVLGSAILAVSLARYPTVVADSALALLVLLPVAWYAGPTLGDATLADHVGANTLAQGCAGLASWLLLAAAVLPVGDTDYSRRQLAVSEADHDGATGSGVGGPGLGA